MNFQQKAISGFKWSVLDTIVRYFFAFIVSIILARVLEPSDFGIVAMVAIFSSISQTLIDGGFGDSLIRKTNADKSDYNTIFTFNLALSILLYLLLFIFSPSIAKFFNHYEIKTIIRITSLSILIGSFSMVQMAILRKQVDFKRLTKINFLTTLINGLLSIYMAFDGFGYWSLIIPGVFTVFISTLLLNYFSSWKPKLEFSFSIFKSHFAFGYKIMLSSLLYMLNQNVYNTFLGKFYSPIELGYFSRADNVQKLPSTSLDNLIRHVTYPLFAQIQDNENNLIQKYRLTLRLTSTLNSAILIGIAANAKLIILTLFGQKWLPSVEYLQMLCLAGVFYPLTSINLNILNIKGRSDIGLFLNLFRFFISIFVLLIGYFYGIKSMILGIILSHILEYSLVIGLVSKIINYSITLQIKDISRGLFVALIFGLTIYLISNVYKGDSFVPYLCVMLIINVVVYIVANKIFRTNEYRLIESGIISSIKKFI
ncbi:MAG: lipopolysaccharide biosynthesis protein [Saprospiraceae bacterium]|nr:lipopolysaccharide biosynthesis protein [Saprospiraceae bacterium]